jgi:hypothetical protein
MPHYHMQNYTFICKRNHKSISLEWSDVEVINCKTLKCKLKAYRQLSPIGRKAQSSNPTVYYRNKKGQIYTPSNSDRPIPKRLANQGYEKVEIKTFRDRDRFYRDMNSQVSREHHDYAEREHQMYRNAEATNRSDLRALMNHMTPEGRDFAKFAMEQNDSRNSDRFNAGVHIDSWENDFPRG